MIGYQQLHTFYIPPQCVILEIRNDNIIKMEIRRLYPNINLEALYNYTDYAIIPLDHIL